MGGSAFSAGESPLLTPRMPRKVYERVKSQCQDSLRHLYVCVASPIDGPGKADFGDVDIFVASLKGLAKNKDQTLGDIATALQATRMIPDAGLMSAHYAIPWPEEGSADACKDNEADMVQATSEPGAAKGTELKGQDSSFPASTEPLERLIQNYGKAKEILHQKSEEPKVQAPSKETSPHKADNHSELRKFLFDSRFRSFYPELYMKILEQAVADGLISKERLFARLKQYDTTASNGEPSQMNANTLKAPSGTIPQKTINKTDEKRERFIQVDVRVCDSFQELQWMLFKHAHGDIWNLLGTTIRPYGLGVDEQALWLRIPEIENVHRNRAKIFLSAEPAEILHFLGLPIEEYWEQPFDSLEDMYEYVARCRLFWVRPIDPEYEGANSLEQDRKKLKHNDRKRMSQRPGFRKWVEEFKPKCREQGRFVVQPTTREVVTKEAFAWFGVEREFISRRREFLLEKQKDMIWKTLIKGSVPEANNADARAILYRSCLVKALRRIILEGDGRYGILPETSLKDAEGFFVEEDVLDFIIRNQDRVGMAAMAMNNANYMEHLKSKAAKA